MINQILLLLLISQVQILYIEGTDMGRVHCFNPQQNKYLINTNLNFNANSTKYTKTILELQRCIYAIEPQTYRQYNKNNMSIPIITTNLTNYVLKYPISKIYLGE